LDEVGGRRRSYNCNQQRGSVSRTAPRHASAHCILL
jgi:hypothetical protein